MGLRTPTLACLALLLVASVSKAQDLSADQASAAAAVLSAAGGGAQLQWFKSLVSMDLASASQPAVRTLGYGDKLASLMSALLPKAGGLAGLAPVALAPNVSISPFAVSTDQLSTLVDGVKDKFCTKGQVFPARKVPSIVWGPQLNITLSTGNCSLSLNGTLDGHPNKTLTCFGPSVSYSRSPITFVAKHHAPEEYKDGMCVLSKTPVGELEETILYSEGEDQHYASVEAFMQAMQAGTVSQMWGITLPAPQAAASVPDAGARASVAVGEQQTTASMQQPGTGASGGFKQLLERAGWSVVMNKGAAAAGDVPGAPAPAPAPA